MKSDKAGLVPNMAEAIIKPKIAQLTWDICEIIPLSV